MLFLAAAAASPAPDALATWLAVAFYLLAGVASAVAIAVGVKSLRAKPLPPPVTPQPLVIENAKVYVESGDFEKKISNIVRQMEDVEKRTHEQIAAVDTRSTAQIDDLDAYVQSSMHSLRNDLQGMQTTGEEGRAEIRKEIGAVGVQVGELRGELKEVAKSTARIADAAMAAFGAKR